MDVLEPSREVQQVSLLAALSSVNTTVEYDLLKLDLKSP